jgi:hypothetical protein
VCWCLLRACRRWGEPTALVTQADENLDGCRGVRFQASTESSRWQSHLACAAARWLPFLQACLSGAGAQEVTCEKDQAAPPLLFPGPYFLAAQPVVSWCHASLWPVIRMTPYLIALWLLCGLPGVASLWLPVGRGLVQLPGWAWH